MCKLQEKCHSCQALQIVSNHEGAGDRLNDLLVKEYQTKEVFIPVPCLADAAVQLEAIGRRPNAVRLFLVPGIWTPEHEFVRSYRAMTEHCPAGLFSVIEAGESLLVDLRKLLLSGAEDNLLTGRTR